MRKHEKEMNVKAICCLKEYMISHGCLNITSIISHKSADKCLALFSQGVPY